MADDSTSRSRTLLTRMRRRVGTGTAAAASISLLGATSKALGLVRELLLAWAFGTGAVVDAFRVGQSLTTYFSHMFFGEAMTGAVVPSLARADHSAAVRVKAGVTTAALVVTLPIALAFVAIPSVIVELFTPGLSPDPRRWAVTFVRVFGLAIPLYCLTSIAVMVRQARSDFGPLGLRPVGQNAFFLAGILAAYLFGAPVLLPVAFLAFYLALLLLVDRGDMFKSLLEGKREITAGLRQVVARWVPLALGLLLLRSNTIIERYFGSLLPAGSIAALDYARTVTELPLLLAVPTGAVLLTALSRADDEGFTRARKRKLGLMVTLLVAWSVLVVALAEPITTVVFRRGAFVADSVTATSAALTGLGLGGWAVGLGYVTTQILMARGHRRQLILAAGLSVLVNALLASLLVPRLEILGLAIASSGAAVAYIAVSAPVIIRAMSHRR